MLILVQNQIQQIPMNSRIGNYHSNKVNFKGTLEEGKNVIYDTVTKQLVSETLPPDVQKLIEIFSGKISDFVQGLYLRNNRVNAIQEAFERCCKSLCDAKLAADRGEHPIMFQPTEYNTDYRANKEGNVRDFPREDIDTLDPRSVYNQTATAYPIEHKMSQPIDFSTDYRADNAGVARDFSRKEPVND